MTEDGRSQPSSSGRTRPSHRLRAAQSARFFQIIPIKMKRAISVRKATLMMATVRNTSVADRGFMSCLASCEAPGVNHSGWKMFRFQTQTSRDASGVGIRGGLRRSPLRVNRVGLAVCNDFRSTPMNRHRCRPPACLKGAIDQVLRSFIQVCFSRPFLLRDICRKDCSEVAVRCDSKAVLCFASQLSFPAWYR